MRARPAGAKLARSWDIGSARAPERRSGAVILLAQLPLRPLIRLLVGSRWIGVEHLPERGAAIACGNHLGPFDALVYGQLLQVNGIAPRFLAKDSLFRVPILGTLLRSTRQIPVHRGTGRGDDALAAARRALARGELMMVFPEGTYSRDPAQWPMRARLGAARLALETGAPLIPIACWGSSQFWERGMALPRPFPRKQITVRVGEPFHARPREGEDPHTAAVRVTRELMAAITALLAETRAERPPDVVHDPRGDALRPEEGMPVRPAWWPAPRRAARGAGSRRPRRRGAPGWRHEHGRDRAEEQS